MSEQNTSAEKQQPGWKIAVGILAFIAGLTLLLIILKMIIG